MISSGANTAKLRVGLLLDSTTVPAWAHRLVERMLDSGHSQLVVAAVRQPGNGHKPARLFRRYVRSEDRRFSTEHDALAPRDLGALLNGTKMLQGDNGVDPAELRALELDVLVYLGADELRGELLTVARQGVWSLHHGDYHSRRGGPPGFWEVFTGESITGATLLALADEDDQRRVLAKSYSYTDQMLIKKSLNPVYWKALSLVLRQLEQLHLLGHEAFAEKIARENRDPKFYCQPHYQTPRGRQFVPMLLTHYWRYLKRRLHNLFFFHQWILMFDFRDGLSTAFWRFKRLVPPKDRIWADPFVVHRDGQYHVFIEEFIESRGRGHISVFTLDETGKHSEPQRVLERPYHLSYPFVFRWKGTDYMIPETLGNSAIELYRCERFPDKWVFDRTLISGIRAADTTLIEHDGKWWLFAAVIENEGGSSWDELFLFHADSPDSTDWKPHPLNPIVSDVRRARPGGRIFRYGKDLYRPAQNCEYGYGSGMTVLRIERLTETEYEEVEVSKVMPRWKRDLVGVHTLSHEGRLTIIDGHHCRNRFV